MVALNRQGDEEIIKRYREEHPWGMSCSIDLKGCDPAAIRDANMIREFVRQACDLIEMKRYGETKIVKFGDDPRVSGYSMTQLIETSMISAHFADQTDSAYVDLFSCKEYPPTKFAQFCKKFFKAKDMDLNIIFRF
jgi:S-adenosylmethionine/arginine decarboxylase-like enzyme